jgi:chromosome segregation ATPase
LVCCRCWVIRRSWGQDGKSSWCLDGLKVGQKVVEKLAKELNIQTENLCQFLPQDKVHEFSRMNPKELLCKTIEAVGETQLREDHET